MGMIAPAPVNARKIIRGAWSIAPVKKNLNFFLNSLLNHFIHFQLQNLAPIYMPSNSSKCKGNLGKIIPCSEIPHLRHAK
jgi:hypothetical protein